QPFRIGAVIKNEPDRFSGEVGAGMRCIISIAGYRRTGIEQAANSVKQRILLRLQPCVDVSNTRWRLQTLFPEGAIRDYRGVHRQQAALTENAIAFLSVAAFLALALGTAGVAIAARQHAVSELPNLAIMRMLGGRNRQLALVFLPQM